MKEILVGMFKSLVGVILITAIVAGGLRFLANANPLEATRSAKNAAPSISNPASSYCEEQGYKSEIRTEADGSQVGACVFLDGTECEEWAFFRGECIPAIPRNLMPDLK